jgi:hypothetical protein
MFLAASGVLRCTSGVAIADLQKVLKCVMQALVLAELCQVQSGSAVLSSIASAPPGLVEHHHGLTQ